MSSSALDQIANALQNGVGIDLNLTGYTWQSPDHIGLQTPNTANFTSTVISTLTATSGNFNALNVGTFSTASIQPSSLITNTVSAGTIAVQTLNSQVASISSIITNNLSTANVTALTMSTVSLNVNNAAISTMTVSGGFSNTGVTSVAEIIETLTVRSSLAGTTTFDWLSSAVWYLSSLTANISAAIVNVPTTANRALVFTLIINQTAIPYYASTLLVNGALTPIRWAGATLPVPVANRTEIESFTLFYIGATWTALGQFTSFAS